MTLDGAAGMPAPGNLMFIAGGSGFARTTLATFIAGAAAIEQGHAVVFYSLELSAERLTQQFVAARGGISISRLLAGCLEDWEFSKLVQVDAELRAAPIFIDDSGVSSIDMLRARIEDMVAQYGIRLVIVDGLDLLHEPHACDDTSRLLPELREMARDLNLPFVALTGLRWLEPSRC